MKIIKMGIQAWRISAVRDGHLVSRTYVGYAKREAIVQFRRELRVQPRTARR